MKEHWQGNRGRAVALAVLLLCPALTFSVFARTGGKPALSVKMPDRGGAAIGQKIEGESIKDVQGRSYSTEQLRGNTATVFLFIGTECPISNAYTPRLLSLAKTFLGKGVQVFAVYSNRNESREQILQHAKQRAFPFPIIRDETGALARRLGARFTPEAVALDGDGVLRYRGRIDDNRETSRVKQSDLREAVSAILQGKSIARAETKAFGCALALAPLAESVKAAHAKTTFARDVAPILQENCQSCHRPGEVGPMALTTYEQASAFAQGIKNAVQERRMPPWHAAEGHGEFQNTRRLTDAQIRTISDWADAGAPLGDKKDLPPPAKFPTGWQLGEPDATYASPEPYEVAADGEDVYRNYVLPTGYDEDKYVTAVEVRAGQKQVVHHVIAYIDAKPHEKGRSLELDANDPGPGYTSSGGGVNFDPSGMLGGWAPGNEPRFLPDGVAIKLPKGSRIVLQVHYHKNGVAVKDRTRIGVYFARKTVKKLTQPYPILNGNMEIPAGAKRHLVTADTKAPADVHAIAIMPHMHLLGQEMKVTATKPDGTQIPLVYVPKWDFRWQNTYLYKEPVALPRGTKVVVEAVYDNSTDNPHNPHNPPKTVRWGEATTDEMCLAYVWITVDAENLSIEPKVAAR